MYTIMILLQYFCTVGIVWYLEKCTYRIIIKLDYLIHPITSVVFHAMNVGILNISLAIF